MLDNSSLVEHVPVDFQAVFESLPGNFVIFQPNAPHYTILAISDEAVNITGREKQSVVGKKLFDVFPDNPEASSAPGPSSLVHSLNNALEYKRVDYMPMVRYDVTNPEGIFEERYWAANNKPIMNQQGEVLYLIHTTEEVTEQVLTRNKMVEGEFRFRNMIEQAPIAIALTRGPEVIIESINAPMLPIMSKESEAEVIGKKLVDVLPEVTNQSILSIVINVFETGQAFRGNELPVSLKVGGKLEEHYFNLSLTPLIEAGKIIGVLHLAMDVTEQVQARRKIEESEEQLLRANQELQQTNQQLTRANIDLDNFIYTASHDLRAPILNIEGLVDALQDQLSPACLQAEEVQYTLHLILNAVQRFKRTIGHLTELTKLQKENTPEVAPVDLANMIAEVQLDLATDIRAARAQIEVNVAECPTIHFSEKNLRSIIYNLLSNALKYCSPKRDAFVQIQCTLTDGYQVLTVRDNGLGMDLNQNYKLFTMFKRFHNHVEGSGIGLYMVKKIIENAGGKIEVQSQEGVGSVFSVYFPTDHPILDKEST